MKHHLLRWALVGAVMGLTANTVMAMDAMKVTKLTTQPIGHYKYCKTYHTDCNYNHGRLQPVELTRARWKEMVEVNYYSNTTIKPVTDQELYGVEEHWTYPTTAGDCEDYLLMKRHMLIQRGWPAAALLATVVLQPNGEGHAVLTVRTDRGDFILDNLNPKIRMWSDTEYKYLKRQSVRHAGKWADIADTRAKVAGIK